MYVRVFSWDEYTAQLMWGAWMCLQIANSCLRYGFAFDYTEEVGLTDFTCPRRWRIMFNCLFVVAAKAAWLEEFPLAVKIRLARHGAKKRPYYRVVVADSRAPRDGRIIEEVGRYNPMTAPKTINLDLEKIADWQSKGAQLTDAVAALVKAANEGEKTETVFKKSKKQLAKEAEAAKAAAEAAEGAEE